MEKIKIEYLPDNKIIEADPDQTILQISLKHHIPHTHVCFGEAQCSTCRVEVLEGIENLPPRNSLEEVMAKKKGWNERIRLACQTIPRGNIKIRRLIIDDFDAQIAQLEHSEYPQGVLEEVVILFLDIKDFTSFSERELPYDVVFALNRYYNRIGDIILAFDGYLDKYIGDSIMAIFGIKKNKSTLEFCIDSIYCALKILEITKEFNQYLKENFNEMFEVRIGIAYGKAVLGMIGHRKKAQYTAIGKVVNLASRLERANKKTGTSILISDSLYQLLKNKIKIQKSFKLKLKGFSAIQIAYAIVDLEESEKEKREKVYQEIQISTGQLQKQEYNETNQNIQREVQENENLLVSPNALKLDVDKQHSQILFQISHLTSIITGIVKDFESEIYMDLEDFTNSKIKLTIPVKAITTFIDARDQHLYSPDFFDAENFPNIIFISNEILPVEQNQYTIYGNLFIRGVSKKINLFLQKKSEEIDPYQNKKICFNGYTTINRLDFNINFNIPLQNNKFLIGNELKILFEFQCIIP
ncbi:MAG: hypothetical protein KatS3mg129_1499 [Leptospiraceae bacterium]|nr:MAG: hypothetical protein KatS3mg129_1499 [Leptospiraceae bacterium]